MFICIAATAAIVVLSIMFILWLIQLKTKKADIVDIAWSYNFAVIAILCYWIGNGFELRKALIAFMVCAWSIRLGTYLYSRVMGHKEEEGRYKQLREDWKGSVNAKFFAFFMFQGILNVILSLPFFIISTNTSPEIHWLEWTGFSIWLVGIIGESTADQQLKRFKSNPENKGKVCTYGLWNYSRHPNYFFEWTMWMAYFCFALATPYGWISVICPAMMLFFLLKVTGIPMTEELAVKTKGEAYLEYQRTTSMFVPWFKKSAK